MADFDIAAAGGDQTLREYKHQHHLRPIGLHHRERIPDDDQEYLHRSSNKYQPHHAGVYPPPGELNALRNDAMKRDRSTHGDDGRDRGRTDRPPPRGPASGSHRGRSRSLSPYSRRAQSFRDRGYSRDDVPPPPPSDDRYDRHYEDRRARERSPDRDRRDDGAAPPKRKKRSRRDRSRRRDRKRSKRQGQHYLPEPDQLDSHHPRHRSRSPISVHDAEFDRGRPSSSASHRPSTSNRDDPVMDRSLSPEQILGGLRSLTHILHFLQKGRAETHQRPDLISGKPHQATTIRELAIRLFHLAMTMVHAFLQALLPLARRANVATSHASASEEDPQYPVPIVSR
ncbi:hypothetical protein PG997_012089 [Apiospora hydei]|uniref:Uncharacterized protein n=1 Tax=Apiospora hydei TaxID=1337664 RepID=A0ABR1V2D2_9PEZI